MDRATTRADSGADERRDGELAPVLAPDQRGGSSQQSRRQPTLDPSTVPIDGRTSEDFLALLQGLAKELRYFDRQDRPAGDWSGLLPADLDLAEIASLVDHPRRSDNPWVQRPHGVLLLVFLRLLQRVEERLNGLTQRHLDYFYRQILHLAPRPAVPDRVHLLIRPSRVGEGVSLPAGTQVDAGPDRHGQTRIYSTDRALTLGRVEVAAVHTLCLDRSVVGFREIRTARRNDPHRGVVELLSLALGGPAPGELDPVDSDGPALDVETLQRWRALLALTDGGLGLRCFELRRLVGLVRRRRDFEGWPVLDSVLTTILRRRTGDPQCTLPDPPRRDFDLALAQVLDGPPSFAGLPDVACLEDLFAERHRSDVQEFVRQSLWLDEPDDFLRLMQTHQRIEAEWAEIRRLLATARERRWDPPRPSLPLEASTDLEILLAEALAEIDWTPVQALLGDGETWATTRVGRLERALVAMERVEDHFRRPAEEVLFVLRALLDRWAEPSRVFWQPVDRVLLGFHREQVYAERRATLRRMHREAGLLAAMLHALGAAPSASSPETADEALDALEPYLGSEADLVALRAVVAGEVPANADTDQQLEIAWRNRQGLVVPEPTREDWRQLQVATIDPTAWADPEATAERQAWSTLGRPQADPKTSAPLGWAVQSSRLLLSTGQRTVHCTLGFEPEGFDPRSLEPWVQAIGVDAGSPWQVTVTTTDGWIEPDSVVAELTEMPSEGSLGRGGEGGALPAFRLTLQLGPDVDALAPLANSTEALPTLRCVLRPVWDAKAEVWRQLYPVFRPLRLRRVALDVEVEGLRPLRLENDTGALDLDKPFEPFGRAPEVGARFFIGHPELVDLDWVRFRPTWMGLPDDLATVYRGYDLGAGASKSETPDFRARIALLERRCALVSESRSLFASEGLEVSLTKTSLPAPLATLASRVDTPWERPSTWPRAWCWQLLAPDFGHRDYPRLATAASMRLARELSNNPTDAAAATDGVGASTTEPIHPPVTPTILELLIDYRASTAFEVDGLRGAADPAQETGTDHRLLRVYPLGSGPLVAPQPAVAPALLPGADHAGSLLLGLRHVEAPTTVSLLFQLADGTARSDTLHEPPKWSLLDGDRWRPLDSGALDDGTGGLLHSGIMTLELPTVEPSTRLPGDLTWLRVAVRRARRAVCDTVAIHAGAVSVTLSTDDTKASVDPSHFDQPLPPGSIEQLVVPRSEVASLAQPYSGFGGRGAESPEAFRTRVSERLRHRGRALTTWDYERLVLDRFPEIERVRCLPAAREARSPEHRGRVEVVVLPAVGPRGALAPFKPRASADLLESIRRVLEACSPASATVVVKNPRYVPVKLRLAIRFSEGTELPDGQRRLTEDLRRFFAPWVGATHRPGAGDLGLLGATVHASSLLDFITQRTYVETVANLRLFRGVDGRFVPSREPMRLVPETPDTVWVAAREHLLDPIPEAGYQLERTTGIGFFQLGLDFVVAESREAAP